MVLIFLVKKVFQKGTMLRHAVVSDNPGGLSVQLPPPPENWQPSENRLLAILVSVIDGK